MRILIIDRDESAANLIKSRIDQVGASVSIISGREEAIEALKSTPVDLVFVDPSPRSDSRQIVISIRRKIPTNAYIILMGQGLTFQEALGAGANDGLAKPFAPQDLAIKIENARTLLALQRRLGNPSEDYPSGGGIISKSAFAQLFLSAIDRADRYGERAYVMFISLRNYTQIKVAEDSYTADVVASCMAQHMAHIRRQSDILAQTGQFEYALLLQRPVYDSEPMDAALRFADTLGHSRLIAGQSQTAPEILISLIEIPTGARTAQYELTVRAPEEENKAGTDSK